jgi:hypothetical protein
MMVESVLVNQIDPRHDQPRLLQPLLPLILKPPPQLIPEWLLRLRNYLVMTLNQKLTK